MLDADAELLAALGRHVPRFRFLPDDLSVQSDAELRARTKMTAGGRVVILSLKALLLLLRQTVARIERAAAAELDTWSSRVLTASSLDDVLGAKVAEPLNEAAQPNQARPRGARRRASG